MTARLVRLAAVALVAVGGVLAWSPAPASATPGPTNAPEYWFDRWDVPALWASGARGQGVTIAEIDTGVTVLPQLRGKVLAGTDLGSLGGDGRTDRDDDQFGHGTAMASIMVAAPGPFGITGLAPDAKILPITVPLDGTTESGQPDRLDAAIRYAADHGAKIINMSLGGKRTISQDTVACSPDEQAAVYYALSKGAVLTAAVGNSGPRRNAIEDPAVCLGVVSVGAVTASDTVASFSTRQPYLTLTAPGVAVPSLGRVAGNAYSGDGTSQATALTSAALALVWSKFPSLTGTQVVARVLATLDHRRRTPSSSYGYGVLDAGSAVRTRVPTSAPDPVADAARPFLQRYHATRTAPAPAAAVTSPGGLGTYHVGDAPRWTSASVLRGAAAALVGLVVLLATGALGLRARRRRAVATTGPDWIAPGVNGAVGGPLPPSAGVPVGAPVPAWPVPAQADSSPTDGPQPGFPQSGGAQPRPARSESPSPASGDVDGTEPADRGQQDTADRHELP